MKGLLDSIKTGNHICNLKKVPENEIHFVAPFASPADIIGYDKENEKYGDLFLGPKSATHKANHDFLKSVDIKCIVSLSNTPINDEFKLSDTIQYYYFQAKDDQDFQISNLFDSIHKIMDDNILKGKNILIHCDMGVSRSGTIVVSYLMKTLKISCKEALKLTKKSRKAVRPNEGFMKQLEEFEVKCLQNNNNNNGSNDNDEKTNDNQ